ISRGSCFIQAECPANAERRVPEWNRRPNVQPPAEGKVASWPTSAGRLAHTCGCLRPTHNERSIPFEAALPRTSESSVYDSPLRLSVSTLPLSAQVHYC